MEFWGQSLNRFADDVREFLRSPDATPEQFLERAKGGRSAKLPALMDLSNRSLQLTLAPWKRDGVFHFWLGLFASASGAVRKAGAAGTFHVPHLSGRDLMLCNTALSLA